MGKYRQPRRAACELCGGEYDQWYPMQKFCSEACRRSYRRAYMRGYSKRYNAENRDAILAHKREFYHAHHDAMLKYAAVYRARRKEAMANG